MKFNAVFVVLSFLCTQRATAQENLPLNSDLAIGRRGYFSLLGSGTVGYYKPWNYKDVDVARDFLGIYFLNQKSPLATGIRFAFSRHTRRDKLVWGVSYYRYSSTLRIDSLYATLSDGVPLVFFDAHTMRDIGNTFSVYFEPRLLNHRRFSLHGHVAIGYLAFALDDITIPVEGGPIQIATRRPDNANFAEIYGAYGVATRYRINDFYSLHASIRHNVPPSLAFSTETVDLSLGVELNLRPGGVATK